MELKVSNVQTLCVHDGPGIRTSVFLSGCPLRCLWCHNPETQTQKPMLIFDAKKCIGCRICENTCRRGVHHFSHGHAIEREICNACGKCISACPTKALDTSMRILTECDFERIVQRQKKLFAGDGGITFSGGEPLLQAEAMLDLIKGSDVHIAIETSGYANEEIFCRVVENVDYVMLDIKLASDTLHKKYTGVSNKPILKNFENLKKSGKPYTVRTPLIPGITDTKENLDAISEIIGESAWEKLKYNILTPSKYERVGMKYTLKP